MEEDETGSGVIWNFDDAESKLIFDMKLAYIQERDNWNLEGAYWALWRLLSEIEPLYDDTVRTEVNEEFAKISKIRNDSDRFSSLTDEEKGQVGEMLNSFYRTLNLEAVDKGYYFRKKKEYLGL